MLTLLAFGTLGFWIWCAIAAIWCIVSVANEWPGRATFGLVVFVAAVYFLGGGTGMLSWSLHHIPEFLALLGTYLVVGAGWSIVKWFFFVKRFARAYKDARVEYLESRGIKDVTEGTAVPESLRRQWLTYSIFVNGRNYTPMSLQPIKLRDHKSRITLWIGYWPFSMAWTLVDDPLRALIREIYDRLQGIFNVIATRVMGKIDISTDTTLPPTPPVEDVLNQLVDEHVSGMGYGYGKSAK